MIFWDAGEVTGHPVAPAYLAEHRRELFPDSFTADLFPSRRGRPSLPADLLGSVLVLKELFDLSDAQTADALKLGLRRKVACGRSLQPAVPGGFTLDDLAVSADDGTVTCPDRASGAVCAGCPLCQRCTTARDR